MFYYFGRKGRLARFYPPPRYPLVVEPFAGSAAYSLHWKPEAAHLVDIDEDTVALWERLCAMSKAEIMAAPGPVIGEMTSDPWHLAAMASSGGYAGVSRKVSPWAHNNFENHRARHYAAANVTTARRYTYQHGTYRDAPDVEACWFIDPPYQHVKGYRHGNAGIDYADLADFCRTRRGQVIVCEQEGADWLPFRPFMALVSSQNTTTREVWWTNNEQDYGGEQLPLL